MSKGCRLTPTENKVFVGIAISKPRPSSSITLSTLKAAQGDKAASYRENVPNPAENHTLTPETSPNRPQTNSPIEVKKLASPPENWLSLEEEAEIVIKTPEGDISLDLNLSDILLLFGNEFITANKGGIALLGSLYQRCVES